MTLEEIERLARDNKPLPEFVTLPDACLYETLSALWATYRNGKIDKDTAHSRKMQIIRKYREFSAAYDAYCAFFREQQDNIRALGTLRTEIAREPDEWERLRLCIQAIGVMTGDRVFQKTELERLEVQTHDRRTDCENQLAEPCIPCRESGNGVEGKAGT